MGPLTTPRTDVPALTIAPADSVSRVTSAGASGREQLRLAELVAVLSLGIDLGFGQPMEHVLRQCIIALRLAERIGLADSERMVVYYTALLVNVGCHSDAHEQAKWFGDDIALKSSKYDYERGVRAAAATMRLVGSGNPPLHRFRVGLEFALSGRSRRRWNCADPPRRAGRESGRAAWAARARSGWRWRPPMSNGTGKAGPGLLEGDAVPIASRLAQLAEFVEVAHRLGGIGGAETLARRRSGSQFDPGLSELLCNSSEEILGGLDSAHTWEAVIAAEPALGVRLSGTQFDAALLAVANFVDLKSPYTLGHARAVSDLAGAAGERLGLVPEGVALLRRAALVHGFGRLGVSNAIWDRSAVRWEPASGKECVCSRI